jgi:hypothetical protein
MAAYRLHLLVIVPSVLLLASTPLRAQQDAALRPLQRLAETGQTEALRGELANRKNQLSSDPGYIFFQGRAEHDGERALRFYQDVANNHPSSQWCEQALLKLAQYNYAVGAYAAADRFLSRLRADYPDSPLLKNSKNGTSSGQGTEHSANGYAVQVGAFERSEDAQDYAQTIVRWGFPIEVREKTVGQKVLSAVWVGRFESKADARNCVRNVKKRYGVEGLVVAR